MTNPHPDVPVPPPDGEPPVKYETQDAHIRTIVLVGCVLVLVAVVVHVALWGLFQYWQQRDERTKRSDLPLVRAEMNQPPAEPRLEAYEPHHAWVYFVPDDGRERAFYADGQVTVERVDPDGTRHPVKLFDLRPGTPASLAYSEPQLLPGRDRVLRIEVGEGRGQHPGEPAEAGLTTILGKLLRVVPTGGPDKREAAEARLERYGWVDEKKQVAHIPIDAAMKLVLERRLLEAGPGKDGDKAPAKKPEPGGDKR
jgi:hypothetical protein